MTNSELTEQVKFLKTRITSLEKQIIKLLIKKIENIIT